MTKNGNIDQHLPLSKISLSDLARKDELWQNAPNWKVRFNDDEVVAHRELIGELGFHDLGNVVDVGCGFGRISVFLAERNETVVGIDRNPGGIAIGKHLTGLFDLPNLTFVCCNSNEIPLDDQSQNGVWFFTALQFMNRAEALSEAYRVLVPGGKMFVGKYNTTGAIIGKYLFGYQNGGRDSTQCNWARRAFSNGPLADGGANWANGETVPGIFERHGFKLDPSIGYRVDRGWDLPPSDQKLFRDHKALIARLDADDGFVSELVDAGEEFLEKMPGDIEILLQKS